jgi:hypothetical protein
MRGRVLEAFLKAERDLASCGRGSQPQPREVRGNDGWVLRPSCEELSLQASAPMPEWEARVPGPKIAKVERRKASGPLARSAPRLASAAQFAPFGAPPPLIGERQRKSKPGRCGAAGTKSAVRKRRRCADGCGVHNARQAGYRAQDHAGHPGAWSRRGSADAFPPGPGQRACTDTASPLTTLRRTGMILISSQAAAKSSHQSCFQQRALHPGMLT